MANLTVVQMENLQRITMMACKFQKCNNQGDCVFENGLPVCKCWLGYVGETCRDTVNNGLSIPLTLGILVFIVGFVILAFVLAFIQQKRKERYWKQMAEKKPLGKNSDFHSSSVKMRNEEPPCV